MNYFNKQKAVFWIMIMVIVINVSAMVTWYVSYHKEKSPEKDTASCGQTCRMLNEELGLSKDQSARVEEINRKFREDAEPVVASIKETRAAMLDELAAPNPDTAKISSFVNSIGKLQANLQRLAVNQFMLLKQVCTPQQSIRLSSIYSEVYGCPKMTGGQGNGWQHRHGKGQPDSCCEKKQ